MAISLITDQRLWDDFIDRSNHGLIFHKWDFLRIMEKYSGYALLPFGIYKGDMLTCVFPLFFKKELGMKLVFSPPPRACVPYLGPVMSDMYDRLKQKRKESYLQSVADDMEGKLRKISPNYVSITLGHGLTDIRPFKWCGFREESHYTYRLNLDESLDDLWAGFDATCKKNIKRCERLGLEIRRVTDAEKFYMAMKKRYEEQGLNAPLYSAQYLADLMDAYPQNLKMFFVYQEDEVIAFCINCEYHGRVIHWLGAARQENGIAGNDFMLWELIKQARDDGFKIFEIQGANQKRLSEFKSKFNPGLETYYSLHKQDPLGRIAEWAYTNFKIRKTITL